MSPVADMFMLGAEIYHPVTDMFMLGANIYPL